MMSIAEHFEQWLARGGDALVSSGDTVFGWLLALPRDAALIALALATVLTSLAARRWCANQDRLRRSVADLRVLKRLKREAKRAGRTRGELLRFDQTAARVRWGQLIVDLRVLGIVLIPLLWLATWAAVRFDYEPIVPGKVYTVTARLPSSSVGRIAHLVPEPWFTPESSLIARAVPDPDQPGWARAVWQLRFADQSAANTATLAMTLRHGGETVAHPVYLDGRRPSPAVVPASASLSGAGASRLMESRLSVSEYRFLGWVPGWPAAGLAPWVVAYLLLSLLLLPIAKRVTGTY